MKKHHKINFYLWLIIAFTIFFPVKIFAQDIKLTDSPIAAAINKYWHYRDRLKYFVIPPGYGTESGLVAGIRNFYQDGNSGVLDFQEEAVYLGYYLGVLATEYKLLHDQSANYNQTLTDIYYALHAYIYHMDMSETSCYGGYEDYYDGFFVRTHFPYNFDLPPELNEGLPPFVNGAPYVVNRVGPSYGCENMSKDQVIGILTGLALVAHLVPSGLTVYQSDGTPVTGFDLHDKAIEITDKIIKFIAWGRTTCSTNHWHISEPDCDDNNVNGHDCTTLAGGFSSAAALITGNPESDYNPPAVEFDLFHNFGTIASTADNSAKWMFCNLGALGNDVGPNAIGTVADMNYRDWAPFYLLLWSVMHDDYNHNAVQGILPEALTILEGAPCEGPYNYDQSNSNFGTNGWATSYRWHSDINEQWGSINGMFGGNYNGLDYMLLLNLYCIVTGNTAEYNARPLNGYEFPVYTGFPATIFGDASYPVFVASEDKIESDAKFHNYVSNVPSINTPAYGTYKAKNSIILRPGFKVESGAYFHGYISDNIGCYDIWTSLKTTEIADNNSNFDNIESDSLILVSLASNKDSLRVFPNPNDGNMSVDYNLNESETGTFILYDSFGKEMMNVPLFNGKNSYTISNNNLEKGIYTFRAFAGNKQIASDKIVVIK